METPPYMRKYWEKVVEDAEKARAYALGQLARLAEQLDSQLVMDFNEEEK